MSKKDDEKSEAPSQHPSNDAILAQEQAIKDEIAKEHELVSAPKRTFECLVQSIHTDDSIRLAKIQDLVNCGYEHVRLIRGDGDCFYRAVAFAFLVACPDLALFRRQAVEYLERGGYEDYAYECFIEELPELSDTNPSSNSASSIEGLQRAEALRIQWTENPYKANASLMVFRLLTAAHLKLFRNVFEVYVEEGQFDALVQAVECIGTEADSVAVSGLAGALGTSLRVAYLDPTPGPLNFHSVDPVGDSCVRCSGELSCLLYRPGHYDLLIQK